MDAASRLKIISAFGEVLERNKSNFGRESALPYPKEIIRQALGEELLQPSVPGKLDALESGFVLLDTFVSDEEFVAVERFEKTVARGAALKASGDLSAANSLAREIAANSDAAIAVMNRTTSTQQARLKQIANMRELRNKGG